MPRSSRHIVPGLLVIAALVVVKLLGIGPPEYLVFSGMVFGTSLALLVFWWSLVHVIAFAALALALGALNIPPFSGEFGVLPAIVIALFVGASAFIGSTIVCFARWWFARRTPLAGS